MQTPSPTAAAIQERYAARVKARLERAEITVADARDGLLDCFLASYFQGVHLGLKSLAAIEGGDDEIARVTAAMFRRRLRAHGASFEAPTVAALAQVKDQTVEVTKTLPVPGSTQMVVQTEVRGSGEPIKLDYRLDKPADAWKIIDVNVGGLWLVQNYRSQFATELNKGGIDGLINALVERNKTAAAKG